MKAISILCRSLWQVRNSTKVKCGNLPPCADCLVFLNCKTITGKILPFLENGNLCIEKKFQKDYLVWISIDRQVVSSQAISSLFMFKYSAWHAHHLERQFQSLNFCISFMKKEIQIERWGDKVLRFLQPRNVSSLTKNIKSHKTTTKTKKGNNDHKAELRSASSH